MIVIIGCTCPKTFKIRFIPYLQVGNVVVEAITPTIVVMHNDVFADFSPFTNIFGRDAKTFVGTRAFTQAVKNITASFNDSSNIWITSCKIVTRFNIWIRIPVRKYGAYICRTCEIMSPYERDSNFLVLIGEVDTIFNIMVR